MKYDRNKIAFIDETKADKPSLKMHYFSVHHSVCFKNGRELFLRYVSLYHTMGIPKAGRAPRGIRIIGKSYNVWFAIKHYREPQKYRDHWEYEYDPVRNSESLLPVIAREYTIFVQDDSVKAQPFPGEI